MKLFFAILLTSLAFFQSSFAADEQSSDQKLAQLQQLLAKAARSGGDSVADIDPTISAAPSQNLIAPSAGTTAAPSAGVTTAPAAQAQDDQQKTNGAATTTNAKDASQEKQPTIYDESFSNVINQMLPMSPEQIAKLREVFTESQLAAATPPGIPPKPTSTSLMVNLSPQATPPVIRLGAGYISSLVFVDATGQPWPIASYSVGDPSAFNIQWDRKGNTLLTQSSTFYKRTNLAVILKDLNTPVMIDLVSGQSAVDYRIDLRIPGLGPNAVYVQNGIPAGANPVLLDVLNGIPPKGSKEMKVIGGDGQAWLLNNKLYLRTKLNVTSPGWQAVMSSIDGTHAYQLQPSPVILALQNGRDKILTLMLEGLE